MKKVLTNPVSGKVIRNCPASYESITQVVEHFWPNKHKIKSTKPPLQPPVYWRRVYKD